MGPRMVFLFLPLLLLPLLTKDERTPPVEGIISIENLKTHIRRLPADRNPYDRFQQLEEAGQYIYSEFLNTGLRVWEEPFQWEGKRFRNIIAEKKGTAWPQKVFILGAHYDTVPGSPGADDNASAIAVLLEVARKIGGMEFSSTIRLVAFSLEEYGFIGSHRHAERAKREGERIVGMISVEMVGFTHSRQAYPPYLDPKYYPNVGDFIAIIGNERSRAFTEKVYRSFRAGVPGLPAEYLVVPENGERTEEARLSDHCPFWERGFPALMVTDTAFLRNPNYHLSTDTMDTLDFEFMRKVTAGIFYALSDLEK